MTGPCKDCWSATRLSHWGGYSMGCIGCCARLVLSCSPDRKQAEAMLAAITMRPGRLSRKEVLAAVRDLQPSKASTSPAPSAQESLL
jgi:hypothetical protein